MESQFFKMDVFFIIASVFSVVIGILVCTILWKILRILGQVEEGKEKIKLFINKWKNRLKINKN